MIIALALLALALPCLVLLAFCFMWNAETARRLDEVRDRNDRMDLERRAWADERRELLNRIKPETAQYPTPRAAPPAPHVRYDDDDSYWQAVESSLSKEELADAVDTLEQQMAMRAPAMTGPSGEA